MSFDRIRSDLRGMDEKLSGGGQITAAELFNMIRDLCEDVRTATGVPVEKNPAGDTAQLLQQLPWMGRLISRQFRTIEDQVVDKQRQEELAEKMRELDRLAEQLELQAGETAVLEDKRKALRTRYAALEAGADRKLELQQECQRLESQIRTASEVTVFQLEEQVNQLKLRQKELEQQASQLHQEEGQLQESCRSTEEECDSLRQTMELLTTRREDLLRNRDRKTAELEQLRQVMAELDGECARLQQKLDQLSHDLADKDREQAKIRLNESIRQREQALEEYSQLQLQIADQQRGTEEQASRNQAAIARQQELKWQAEQAQQQAMERIEALKKDMEASRSCQEALDAEEASLKEQSRKNEEWLRSLELQQFMQRLEQLRQRNRLLTDARAALEADLDHIRAVKNIPAGEPDPALFQASFQDTEKWITHYQKLFGDTLRLLSSVE